MTKSQKQAIEEVVRACRKHEKAVKRIQCYLGSMEGGVIDCIADGLAISATKLEVVLQEEKQAKKPNDRVSSDWKCDTCGRVSKGHNLAWISRNGTPGCDCGSDMQVYSITIDGVTQKV